MLEPAPPTLQRSLVRLRRRGKPVHVVDLAQGLLALSHPVSPGVARRLVAAALGCAPASLPDRIEARHLRPAPEAALADVPLVEARFAVVDLETTGLSVDRCQILEIGAVRVEGLRRTDAFSTLVRPPGRIPEAIQALTGILDAHVVDAPPPGRAVRAFRRWLERCGSGPFVAHNARFDARFVARAFSDHQLPPYAGPVLCTHRLARRILPGIGRYNLDQLCAHFGIANPARHRATGDAEATARALIEMLEMARRDGVRTLGDLLDLQERPLRRGRRRRAPRSSPGGRRADPGGRR